LFVLLLYYRKNKYCLDWACIYRECGVIETRGGCVSDAGCPVADGLLLIDTGGVVPAVDTAAGMMD